MLKRSLLMGAAIALAVAAPAGAKDLTAVGITVGNLGNPFFVQVAKGAEAKAKEIGGDSVTVTTVSADYDLNKQYSQIDNFIASGVDLILVNAADPEAIEPAIKRAQAAGIVVVAVDVSAKGADAMVQTNNIEAGQKACQYIVEKLPDGGNVGIMKARRSRPRLTVSRAARTRRRLAARSRSCPTTRTAKGRVKAGLEVMVGLLTAFPILTRCSRSTTRRPSAPTLSPSS